jgi:hypothetical protein
LGGPGPDDEDTSGSVELHDDRPDEGSGRVVVSAGTAEEHVDGATIDPERIDLGEHDSDGPFSRRPLSLTTDASTTRAGGFVFFDDYFDQVPLEAGDLEEMVGFQLGNTESRGLFLMPVGSEGLNSIAGEYMSLGAQDFHGEIGLRNADGNPAGRVRADDSGLVLTDPDGNPALRIASDGAVHVTDGAVQPEP